MHKYAQKYGRTIPDIDAETLHQLEQYDWPGNIRELQNRVERALILSEEDCLFLADFGLEPSALLKTAEREDTLLNQEKDSILKALKKHNGNISQTAEELGLSRGSLYRRLEKFNLKS